MPVAAALPYLGAAASVAGVVNQADAARKTQHAAQDAINAQRELAANLKYQPIDIEKLKADAHNQAVLNATQALSLERAVNPELAATREAVTHKVASDLALGGKLSPDVMNQVARASRTVGSLSGAPAGPLTAATIGQTAGALEQQRLANAGSLLAANKLPVAGLDPGALASLEVSQNAAMNDFNAKKAGINSNLIASNADRMSAAAGIQAGVNANLINKTPDILSQIGRLPVFNPQDPSTNKDA